MILVIDAYNVLKTEERVHDISQRQRHHFIMQLVSYAKKKDHTVVIVFDGGPYEWPFVSFVSKGSVVYSGYNKTADDYIRRYLSEHKHNDLFLVSSDRELIRKAKQCKICHMGAHEFYQKVKAELFIPQEQNITGLIKLTDRDNDELDDLMQYNAASMIKGMKQEDVSPVQQKNVQGAADKKSKTERIMEKKLSKL